MSAIQVFRSNRTEVLVEALHGCLSQPLTDPLAPELLVVQGRGMAVWLSMQLAKRRGVWANAEFVYPKGFVRRAFAATRPEAAPPETDPYAREHLLWAVLSILPSFIETADFDPLKRYLQKDTDGVLRLQLAERIAGVFDEYLTYRPDLIRKWEGLGGSTARLGTPRRPRTRRKHVPENQLVLFGQDHEAQGGSETHEAWQATLWRALVAKLGPWHSVHQETQFLKALQGAGPFVGLPERISIFGLSNLPPFYVRVLAALAPHTRVQLFLLSPSREYFGDAIRRQPKTTFSAEQNPILLSSGTLGAELHEVLIEQLERLGVSEREESLFLAHGPDDAPEPAELTMLQRLQNDILEHKNGPLGGTAALDPADSSIRLHACHSPIREVEVLHDQLLALLDGAPDGSRRVRPEDVVVMMPNVDEYAPLIEAVFERSRDDSRFIPYRISDRGLQADSPVLDALMRILTLAGSRCTASEVLDLLALGPVRERFGLSASELPQVADWVRESNIRWGIDAGHRRDHGVSLDDANTWLFGIRRLLLGYAVSAADELTLGVLPYAEIEGNTGAQLGRFVHFTETLFTELQRLSEPRSALEWQSHLGQVLTRLLAHSAENAWQHQQVLSALEEVAQGALTAQFDEPIQLPVIRRLLAAHFSLDRTARGFLAGGVTFCAMVPMRSIPFRVVCLLGMSDAAFPRQSHRADFNLLEFGGDPRQLGDPNKRIDDRYLFLEVLLSAREKLLISYIGQSVRDNAAVPASIVVTELLDYLLDQYGRVSNREGAGPEEAKQTTDARRRVLEQIVTTHPLQPFSPRYFSASNPQLFSYEGAFLQGAKLLGPERRPTQYIFSPPIPPAAPDPELALAELLDFFASPAAFLLRSRLSVNLEEDLQDIRDREPLELDGLSSYQVGAHALDRELRGIDQERSLQLARASGFLPAGAPGQYEFSRVLGSALPIAQAVRAITVLDPHEALVAQVPLAGGRILRGELGELWNAGQVSYQYSRVRGKHILITWIKHLVLCYCRPSGVAPFSWLVGRSTTAEGALIHRFKPASDPLARLNALVDLYLQGQTEPLLLFPDASLAFTKALTAPRGDVGQALFHANTAWRKELGYSRVLQRLYSQDATLTEQGPSGLQAGERSSFREVSERVFRDLLEHLEEVG